MNGLFKIHLILSIQNNCLKQKNPKLPLEILNILKRKTNYLAPHSFKDSLFILT